MKKPVFNYSNALYTASWILTVPILIDICTACTLFSMWIVWVLFFIVLLISIIRLFHAFAQKCYKFAGGLIAQLVIGACILTFFQLSFNHVIETPVSNAIAPDVVEIANPVEVADSGNQFKLDNTKKTDKHEESSTRKREESSADKANKKFAH